MPMEQDGINRTRSAISATSAMQGISKRPIKPRHTKGWLIRSPMWQASCQQCHAADLQDRAQVYASALGVEVGSGTVASASSESEAVPVSVASAPSVESNQCNEVVVDDPNVTNYAQAMTRSF